MASQQFTICDLQLTFLVFFLLFVIDPCPAHASPFAQALPSLQSYTGIWNMPTARVLPDWSIRLNYGYADPYRYYGGAVGLWGRLEIHGQFTEITTIQPFPGQGYGHEKDRSAGIRVVLKKESEFWPQVAIGINDATGNSFFGSRYLVASKMFKNIDFTFGLGQGILAGEFIPDFYKGMHRASGFLTSNPFRKTKPFGGVEWHVTPHLTVSAEYSPIDWGNMYGFRSTPGTILKEDDSRVPINIGLKFRLKNFLYAQLAYLRGDEVAGSIGVEFSLKPEGMLPWKMVKPKPAGERLKWRAFHAQNEELAKIVAERIKNEGFDQVGVSVGGKEIWIEARNIVHLSDSRALGHIAVAVDPVLPARIQTLYLNLRQNGEVLQSLRTSRKNLEAFLGSYQDKDGFLDYADLDLYGAAHWRGYRTGAKVSPLYHAPDPRFTWEIKPRLRTFLDNRKGFFKSKGVVQTRGDLRLWPGAQLDGEYELTLFNQFDQLDFAPLERDAVRTDLILYDAQSEPRVTMLALDQVLKLPYSVEGRVDAGIFESAFAGFGAEVFRYFDDGLWGLGLESETVRKRDVDSNFKLMPGSHQWFTTGFLNVYAQLWPAQGVEAGLKIGRFLAGDPGVEIDLRRSFKYFTLGGWYTVTDTSCFSSPQNRGAHNVGVYIRIPFSIFTDHDARGHFRYEITSFTRDQGATVRQPRSLYPMDPWSTPNHTKRTLGDMRIQ